MSFHNTVGSEDQTPTPCFSLLMFPDSFSDAFAAGVRTSRAWSSTLSGSRCRDSEAEHLPKARLKGQTHPADWTTTTHVPAKEPTSLCRHSSSIDTNDWKHCGPPISCSTNARHRLPSLLSVGTEDQIIGCGGSMVKVVVYVGSVPASTLAMI
jgi:hypothetical protein